MASRAQWPFWAVVGTWLGGCNPLTGFGCTEDDQCERADSGRCEAIGFCSYPDDACASGRRFSPHAADPWARVCTDEEPSGTSSSLTTSSDSGSAGSTDSPTPVCGNGVLEADEACDDGNEVSADGCNPDCRPSGLLIDELVSKIPHTTQAYDFVLLDDGYVLAGMENASGNQDGLVVRWDAAGQQQWAFRLVGGADRNDVARSVELTADERLVVSGFVIEPASMNGNIPRPDFWLAELDPDDGTARWQHTEGEVEPSAEQARDLVVDPSGDLVIVGRDNNAANHNIAVRAYAFDPRAQPPVSQQWSRSIGGPIGDRDWGFAALVDANGNIVAGGAMHTTEAVIDRHLVVLAAADGSTICSDTGNGSDDDRIWDLALAPDGTIVAAGSQTSSQEHGHDAWIAKYEPSGCKLVWQRLARGDGMLADEARGVAVDDLGRIVAVGRLHDGISQDIWVQKRDETGELLWQADLVNGPGNGTDLASSVVPTADGEIIVAGYISRPGGSAMWIGRYTE